ncbi:MAG: type II toxin-antitoxin system RelE/ParE family toxin [Pseudomonadota bacterium]|nr:type II toxin-antitoxin system RelE/ParE family toxin [Pseudomonadota bacterium]
MKPSPAISNRDSPWYATAVASRIVNAAESVAEQPELGRVVPELGQASIRERFVDSYRVIYRVEDRRILIVTVIHGSRLLQQFADRMQDEPEI